MESSKINKKSLYNPTSFKTLNTDFLDDKTTQRDDALGKGQTLLDPLAKQSITDTTVMPTTRLFSKPILVLQSNWSTATGVTYLYYERIANILNKNSNSQATTLLQIHSYFRSGFKFTLRVNSSPFHSGKLALVFVPPRDSVRALSRNVVSGYPVAYADAGNSSVVSLMVPFVTIRDFVSTAGSEGDSDFGAIAVYNFNKLAIGTGGPASVGYTIWMEPIDTELGVPRCSKTVSLQSEDVALGAASISMPDLPDLMNDVRGISDMLSQHSLKGSPSVPPLNKVLTGLTSNKQSVRDSRSMPASYAGSTPSISNMNGHKTEHLSLVPEEMRVADPFTIEGRDIDSIAKIAQVPMLLRTVSWNMSDAPNTRLFVIPVTPSVTNYSAPTANAAGFREYTYCSYVAQPFEFWRGSLDFRITVASTQQHTGRLIASWIPADGIKGGDSVIFPGADLDSLALLPSVVFDLAENREFNISIPYEASTPFRRLRKADIGTDVTYDSLNGLLLISVLNGLSGPGTVSNVVDVNVFMSAGKDIQFKGLKTERNSAASIPYLEESASSKSTVVSGLRKKEDTVKLQSMDVALESSKMGMETDKANSVSLDVPEVVSDSDQGESDVSLTKLLSRYYPQCGFRFTVANQANKVFRVQQHPGLLFQQNPTDTTITTFEFTNLINHFRNIFAFWSGSLNYFFLHNTTVNNPVLATFTHKAGVPVTSASTNYPNVDLSTCAQVLGSFADSTVDLSVASRYSHISNLRINSSVEITLPYRSIFRRSLVSNSTNYQDDSCMPGTLEVLYSNPSTTDQLVSLQLFQSVGDDFRYHYLVPPRRHFLKATG